MATGIDIAGDTKANLDRLKAAGVSWVGRYYATHSHLPGKILTLDEARAISAAELKIVAVWENGLPTTAEYFTADQGREDANSALGCASKIGQPSNTPIYFAIDCDLGYNNIASRLFNYFVGIRSIFLSSSVPQRPVGVYGSGLVCEKMTDWVLASYSWLAGAKDWEGYNAFVPRATIVQGPLPSALHNIDGFPYSDSDGDTTSTDDYGGFQVPVSATA